jgi:hypothetical protein
MDNLPVRVCSKCKVEKPLTRDFYSSHGSNKAGLRPDCLECCRARHREIYKRDRNAILVYQSNYRKEFPNLVAVGKKNAYKKNKSTYRAKHKQYALDNPDKIYESARKRRARKSKAFHQPYTWQEVIDLHGSNCWLCGLEIDLLAVRRIGHEGWEQGLQLDHVIPLNAKGPDVLWNVQPTHGVCNLSRPKNGIVYSLLRSG